MDLSNSYCHMSLKFKVPQEQEAIFIGFQDETERKKTIEILQSTKGKRSLEVSAAGFMDEQQRLFFFEHRFFSQFYVKLFLDIEKDKDMYLSNFVPLDSFVNIFASYLSQAINNNNFFEDARCKFEIVSFGIDEMRTEATILDRCEVKKCC